jgi:ATP-dependent Clp protease ATP-binding subunit ClpX
MSDKETDPIPPSLEEQIRDMLQKANVSFFSKQSGADAGPEAAAPSPRADDPAAEAEEDPLKPIREFQHKPRDVRDYLDRFVVQQEEAKKVLSVAICDHYNHVRRCIEGGHKPNSDYAKHNIMLLGPTGVGKTYMLRCAAKLIGVPFVKADATKFTETGYVGHDVEDLVRDLVKAADGNTNLAQYGIIFLDEIDKIAASSSAGGKDVSGRGVQINLLKLMEETDVNLFSQTDLIGQMQAIMDIQKGGDAGTRNISTRHILFIVSGAFDKLGEQVQKRVAQRQIGFTDTETSEVEETEYLKQAGTRDFIEYGFEPEFVGRLPVRVVCEHLRPEDLVEIMLKSEGSVLDQYRGDFEGYGIDMSIAADAVHAIAELAHAEKTGARGLMTVLERLFRNFKYELPSTPIRSLDVTKDTVSDPEAALKRVMDHTDSARRDILREELDLYISGFAEAFGIKLSFTKDAAEALLDICTRKGKSVRAECDDRFRDFEYGVKLITRNTGRMSFSVTRKLVENPSDEISKRIAKSFQKDND